MTMPHFWYKQTFRIKIILGWFKLRHVPTKSHDTTQDALIELLLLLVAN
jgi:hypothetical protein